MSEGICLDVILEIVKSYPNCEYRDLNPTDVRIKENRNKKENTMTAVEAFQMARNAKISRESAYRITDLDPNYAEMADADRLAEAQDFDEETERLVKREIALAKARNSVQRRNESVVEEDIEVTK